MRITLSDHFTYQKLLRFTMPSIVMMIITSVYSIVDGFFVSNCVGKNAFAALTNLRSVGVMGDERTYDYAIALRAVETQDFMTADFSRLPWELLDTVSRRIVNEVKGVNRILYDVTSKPPATVELE